jgi:hypothetical protein
MLAQQGIQTDGPYCVTWLLLGAYTFLDLSDLSVLQMALFSLP